MLPQLIVVVGSFAALTGSLFASNQDVGQVSVPEPSIAVLGGLCGIIFLLWRKK